jgi:nucleoside 2-deoxyribosyltransferase
MANKSIAFVIMQIGNEELDKIYTEVFVPAIIKANLDPKRIDKDNEGKLLKSEIVEYLEKAEIIIADLTNERPNCYLEVGYAMGLDKYKNLIITVKEDHYHDSPNYKIGGPRIHFDITGYDILFWDPTKIEDFQTKLTDKINRRLSIISPRKIANERPLWDRDWLAAQRKHVYENFKKIDSKRQMEVLISPMYSQLNIPQLELLETADQSQIQTFGWPIAVVFKNVPTLKPIPKTDGIISEVHGTVAGNTYDYSYFKKNGQIYLATSLYEDRSHPKSIIPDIRLKRMTELLLYISRFYTRCNLNLNENIKISVKYLGLLNSSLGFHDGGIPLYNARTSKENESTTEIVTSLSEIESKLPELVNELLNGLFILFDFYTLNIEYVKLKVDEFVTDTNRQMNNSR